MKSKVIIVFGYQHCGVTILKRCFGSHPHTQEVPDEVEYGHANIPWMGTPTMVMKHSEINAPCIPPFDPVVRPYLVVRNPLDVMASLKLRYPGLCLRMTPKPFRMWENWARLALLPDHGYTVVKYEDLFEDNFSLIYELLSNEGLACEDIEKQLADDPKPIKWTHIPKSEPPRRVHEAFRSWQINQPLHKRTQDPKILGSDGLELIKSSKAFQELYPDYA